MSTLSPLINTLKEYPNGFNYKLEATNVLQKLHDKLTNDIKYYQFRDCFTADMEIQLKSDACFETFKNEIESQYHLMYSALDRSLIKRVYHASLKNNISYANVRFLLNRPGIKHD